MTASPNPSAPGEAVTFTFSGSGQAYDSYWGKLVPPYGRVTFQADGTNIDGCINLWLNYLNYGIGNHPAECTTSALGLGTHEIKAVYTDSPGYFYGATVTLDGGQTVGTPDTTAPTITPNISGTLGSNGWYTSDVSLDWTVTDAESAISSQSSCDPASISSDQASTAYTCSATSAGGTNSVTVHIARDATKPVIAVTGVTEGAIYTLGSVPQAGCSATDATSGVATEATVALSGGDTWGVGNITATCSGATDNAGNASDATSVHYTVNPASSADLSLTKVDSKDPVKPGAQLVYTLTVKNLGPNTAQSLKLVDTLDRNTTYVSIAAPKGWTCKYANYAVTCTSTSLASGSSAIIKITVTVSKTAKVGKELVNNATVSSTTYDPVMTNNSVVQKTMVSK